MGIRADIKQQGPQADGGLGTASCSPFECQETTPRGRGGKKVTGVFVAHYYGVRSKLRRWRLPICAHLPYCSAAYEPVPCGCYLHLWKAYANASKQFKQGNLVYKRAMDSLLPALTFKLAAIWALWQGALAYIVGAKAKQRIIDRGSMLARRPNCLFCRLLRGSWPMANSDNSARVRVSSCTLTNDGAVDGAGAPRTISYKHRRDIHGASV